MTTQTSGILGDSPSRACTSSIPLFKVAMSDNAATPVTEVLESGYMGQGPAPRRSRSFSRSDGVGILERAPDRESSFWLCTMHVERRDDFMEDDRQRIVQTNRSGW
jgi:hypothetical protein